jgi:hypothetical protein
MTEVRYKTIRSVNPTLEKKLILFLENTIRARNGIKKNEISNICARINLFPNFIKQENKSVAQRLTLGLAVLRVMNRYFNFTKAKFILANYS